MSASESEPDDLPPPSAEAVLIRVFVGSYLATAHEKPRRRARAFLRVASEMLADEQSVSLLLPIRPPSKHAEVAAARRQAIALFRQLLPTLLAKVPPEKPI